MFFYSRILSSFFNYCWAVKFSPVHFRIFIAVFFVFYFFSGVNSSLIHNFYANGEILKGHNFCFKGGIFAKFKR